MAEFVFCAPDPATLAAAGQATGFYDATAKQVIANGPLTDGGSWFYNFVGAVYQTTGATTTDSMGNVVPVITSPPGVWGRLRVNGVAPNIATILATARNMGVTIYERLPVGPPDVSGNPAVVWSSDGVTVAPEYVDMIGVIA